MVAFVAAVFDQLIFEDCIMALSSANKLSKSDVTLNDVSDVQEQGFERCAERYAAQARTYARGLQTALFIQRFKQGLLNRS